MGSGMSRPPVRMQDRWQKERLGKNKAFGNRLGGGPKIEGLIKNNLTKLNGPYKPIMNYTVKYTRDFIRALRTVPNGPRKAEMYTQQLNAVIKRRNAKAAAARPKV